jgi:hypothetical protein
MFVCEETKAYFYRLNPVIPENVKLDTVDDEKLINVIWQTKVFVRQNFALFREIGDKLTLY